MFALALYAHYLARRARLTLMTEETDGKMVENISELNMNMTGKRVHEEILARHAYVLHILQFRVLYTITAGLLMQLIFDAPL